MAAPVSFSRWFASGTASEVNLQAVLDDLYPRHQGGGPHDLATEFPGSAMHQYSSDILPARLLLQQFQIPAKLLEVLGSWRALLAFDDDRPLLPIKQEHVKARAISKHLLSDLGIWIRD